MSEYLQYLIWMMLFVIVIEMIFPDLAYKKYLKLVLGCILVYTLLQPIVSLVQGGDSDYEAYVEQYQQALGTVENGQELYESQLEEQRESLESFYQTSMKQYIEQQMEVKVLDLRLKIEEGEIESVDMIIGESDASIEIGTIHIGDKSDTVAGNEEILKNKIKTCLQDFYNVQVGNIYITVQKN